MYFRTFQNSQCHFPWILFWKLRSFDLQTVGRNSLAFGWHWVNWKARRKDGVCVCVNVKTKTNQTHNHLEKFEFPLTSPYFLQNAPILAPFFCQFLSPLTLSFVFSSIFYKPRWALKSSKLRWEVEWGRKSEREEKFHSSGKMPCGETNGCHSSRSCQACLM